MREAGLLSLFRVKPEGQALYPLGETKFAGALSFAVRCILKQNEKNGLLACDELEVTNKLPTKSTPAVTATKYRRFIPLVFRKNL